MLTFRQFVDQERRRIAQEYAISLSEVTRFYPDSFFRSRWWSGLVGDPEALTAFVWRTLSDRQQRDILRTEDCLRSPELTRRLIGFTKRADTGRVLRITSR